MDFKTVLLISATLMGFVTFAEAHGGTSSENSKEKIKGKSWAAVEFANSQDNPLRELNNKPHRTFDCNGDTMTIEYVKGPSLSGDHDLHDWVKSLLKRNMQDTYKESTLLSDSGTIMEDVTEDKARLLIARTSSGKPVGLAHFRFEIEQKCNEEVVHCWDLQVEEFMRGRGIGTNLLDTVTDIAKHFNMRKTILTVFTENTRAYKLYTRLGFSVDKTSPKRSFFLILSKPNESFKE